MFAIPNCSRSIGIQVLLAIAFGIAEFPVDGNTIPANDVCLNVSDEIICYFKGSDKLMNWSDATHHCRSVKSTLLVIRNENDQEAVAGYLKSLPHNSSAWTAGKNFTYSSWKWINGDSFEDVIEENEDPDTKKDNAALETDCAFKARADSEELPYICQYEAAYCNFSDDKIVNQSCLRLIGDTKTWYAARNQCLMNRGDLAVIGNAEHAFLKQLQLNEPYWIGLRKKSFHSTLDNDGYLVESNDEIKYTNWDNGFASYGDCISIVASMGTWKAHGCNELKTVVCQRGPLAGVASTTTTTDASAETTHTFTPVSEESTIITGGSQSSTQQSTISVSEESTITGGSQSSTPQGILFVAVGVGIIVVICIIVIVVFVLRTKNGRRGQSKLNDGYVRNNGDELNTRISNAPVYTSINEPVDASVDRSDDIRGVYADIAMLTPEQSEDGGTNQQPGIVYASLDFNKDPNNLEPDKTHATSPTKVGPLGDIYAIPDARGHAVTSPGDESPSHPVKVTPQGDVYAIPMKMSTSPTAKTPIGAVYENLQPATFEKEQVAEDNYETK